MWGTLVILFILSASAENSTDLPTEAVTIFTETTVVTQDTRVPDTPTVDTVTTEKWTPETTVPELDEEDDPVMAYIERYNAAVVYTEEDVVGVASKRELELDQAWLTINTTVNYVVEIWAQSEQCYKCDLMFITSVQGPSVRSIVVNATFATDLRLVRKHPGGNPEQLCGFQMKFQEYGDYWIFIDYPATGEESSCKFVLANDPSIAELPIIYLLIGLISLAMMYAVGKRAYSYFRRAAAHRHDSMDVTSDQDGGDALRMSNGNMDKEGDVEEGTEKPDKEESTKKARLKSLDTFRGVTLVLMIFVNYGGGSYWFFEHAPWNGIYVADLVFPWFVFIMGVSMNFSFKSMFRQEWSVARISWKIVWRAAQLFAIGFMLGTHYQAADLDNVRALGVLQRLALTYLISAAIHFCCSRKFDSHQDKKWAVVRDLVLYVPEWLANLSVLAVHLGLVYALPVPGCPTGYVGPGGLSEGGKYHNCTGGATQYVDSILLGKNHMYQWPTPQVLYQTSVPFDPEGFLATLNCVFLCFLGIQCGRIILIYQTHKERLIRFVIWALILGTLGAILTKCSQDDGWVPANKNIWSVSYTLITASFGYVLLSALYVLTDILGIWEGQPFIYPGMNSILIYCLHGIFHNQFPVNWEVDHEHWKLLLRCTWGTSIWVIVSYWLFHKKIFIAL
ncbi:heparan-alpha-glucosaminide N-acetyltransferase-like isoform X2 [Physella acuta]|uniref:heparan-alpha-glucosaminide N-acetyltransferase-like isoform X2 n=1 Tax=Physella acuta TaxID=109671 RepID=UPI0027DE20A1|nr:heparan-alpha-glucosaminide N-acetyltransferase-like isoform X2 [Physella acuta]